MKQKIVIRVSMNNINCQKCRRKAMKIAVRMQGVESAAITGEEKNQLEVVGNGIDSVELTRRLRKNVAHAELVSVDEAKKDKDKDEDKLVAFAPLPPYYYSWEVREPTCTIL